VQKDLLKLYAYGTLANFWVTVGAKDSVDEDEAQAFLQLQQSLIKQVERTLEAHLDEAAMDDFRRFVSHYRIRLE
jgi:hypothetical protein